MLYAYAMELARLNRKQSPTSLHQLMFVLQHMSNELLLAEAGVGLSQTLIMSGLSRSVPSTQNAVAFKLKQTEANISRQLQVMKKEGLVSIKQARKDRRQKEVILTTKGANRYAKACNLLDKQQKEILKLIASTEAKVFGQTVDSLLKSLQIN